MTVRRPKVLEKLEEYEKRVADLVPWQQYLRSKWMSTLFEVFKDVKQVWKLAERGTEEEKRRVDERLSDIFYGTVAPAVFKLFGDDILANYTWDDFAAAVFDVAGIDIDRDFLSSSEEMKKITPGIEEWAKA